MRKKRKISPSRDKYIKQRKKDVTIKQKSPSSRKRAQKRKKQMQKVYRRRRIILAFACFLIIFGLGNFVINKINSYGSYSYPNFRDQVREDMGKEIFIGSTDDRSLTTAEKLSDLETLYETISRNYAVRASNRDDFVNFVKAYEITKKKVLLTKTDQEYFDLLIKYTDLLANSRSKILDKKSYDDLLDYYKNNNKTYKSKVIQNPQAVNRYKRMISEKYPEKQSIFTLRSHVLILSMNDFKPGNINKDIKEFTKIIEQNQGLSKILIDLTDNDSLDNVYWQKFLPLLAHKNYEDTYMVFYRGQIINKSLEDMKKENKNFQTTFVKNQASKYREKLDQIDLNDYMYYDEVKLNLENDNKIKKMGIYVILNDKSSNEAINFAKSLKESSDAMLIKNSSKTDPSQNDLINNYPVDFFVLEHSGLLVSIDNSFSTKKDQSYLSYDQFINTDNPLEAILSTL
ncbi:MAG: hypothetical protein PUG67_04010 [Peptoniphilaceae bacterium]|nr:hypothetical protein [Peptoniphilaceae bacterium]MDY6018158.1 hypothetical protein [Anaerococcus sp.]